MLLMFSVIDNSSFHNEAPEYLVPPLKACQFEKHWSRQCFFANYKLGFSKIFKQISVTTLKRFKKTCHLLGFSSHSVSNGAQYVWWLNELFKHIWFCCKWEAIVKHFIQELKDEALTEILFYFTLPKSIHTPTIVKRYLLLYH